MNLTKSRSTIYLYITELYTTEIIFGEENSFKNFARKSAEITLRELETEKQTGKKTRAVAWKLAPLGIESPKPLNNTIVLDGLRASGGD